MIMRKLRRLESTIQLPIGQGKRSSISFVYSIICSVGASVIIHMCTPRVVGSAHVEVLRLSWRCWQSSWISTCGAENTIGLRNLELVNGGSLCFLDRLRQ